MKMSDEIKCPYYVDALYIEGKLIKKAYCELYDFNQSRIDISTGKLEFGCDGYLSYFGNGQYGCKYLGKFGNEKDIKFIKALKTLDKVLKNGVEH